MRADHLKLETNQNSGLLFRVKLNMPLVQSKLISRTRLDAELNQGLKSRLILVRAPAGFGKTTAVVKWLEQVNRPVTWFSIDSSDNSVKRFWHYLVASLEPLLPEIENRFSQYFATANDLAVQGLVTALVDELYRLDHDFIMVMDDYHLVKEASIHESIAVLIKYLPPQASLVIISRSNLPFDSVRLQAMGHIAEINFTDLQFNTEEITDFCQEMDIFCTVEDVKALASHTEGWPAGLYLLLDAARQDGGFARLFLSAGRKSKRLSSYLTEEVMNGWAEEEKEFMLKTSILPSMTGSLCDALTGRADGKQMLERLSGSNAFIVSLDTEGNWYRYHHLYAEFLQDKLAESHTGSKNSLHEQAGVWCENNGFLSDAVNHFLQGGVYQKAAVVIEKLSRAMLKTGEISTLLGWLGRVAGPAIEENDTLCLTYAWALGLSGRFSEAEQWARMVEARYSASSAARIDKKLLKQMKTEMVVFRGFMGIKQQRAEDVLRSVMENMDMLLDDSTFIAYGLNFNMGEASLLAGIFGYKGHLNLLDQYADIYDQVRKRIAKNVFGYVPVLTGEVLLERNRLEEAIPHLVLGINEAENGRAAGSFLPGIFALARIRKLRGDLSGAWEIVRDGEKKLRIMGSAHFLPILDAFKARLNIETGEDAGVENWLQRNCLDIYDIGSSHRMYEYLTLVRALLAKKDYNNALLLLFKLLLLAEKDNNLLYQLEIHNLQAIVHHALGQTQKSMETLRQSLQLGEKHHYEQIFIEEGLPMATLLARFIKWNLKQDPGVVSPVSPAYVRKLIKQTRDYCLIIKIYNKEKVKSQSPKVHLRQPINLTKREKDVLRLLASELSNAEIAYTLDISINTVKVNCTNIYRKLEVKNRDQAVRLAREGDILPLT